MSVCLADITYDMYVWLPLCWCRGLLAAMVLVMLKGKQPKIWGGGGTINHASAPPWGRITVTKHTHTLMVEVIFRYSRVQSFCFQSLERLWLVVQQTSRQRISPWGWSHVTVCVCAWESKSEREQGHVRECVHLSALKPAANVKCEYPGLPGRAWFPARPSPERHLVAWGCLSQCSILPDLFAVALSLFLLPQLIRGKKRTGAKSGWDISTRVTAELKASP